MSHPDRPTGKTYDVPTPKIAVGMKLARDLVMHDPFYRREILHRELRHTRSILNKLKREGYLDDWNGKRMPEGNKAKIRQIMRVLDTAYEVEIVGIIATQSQCCNSVANQCYIGGGSGWGGIYFGAQLLFRATQPDEHRPGQVNHVAFIVAPENTWYEFHIQKAIIHEAK